MRFAVLGPLAVFDDSGPVPVRSAKQRVLLALLLTRPNRTVSVPALAETLWTGEPPAAVDKSVAWHVHKLRKLLDDEDRVARTDNGYRIRVGAGDLDAVEFEAVCHAPSAGGDPAETVTALTEGLALWRGPAFGDLADLPAIRGPALRLDDLRTLAVERRVDVELELGRHAELVPELTGLVEEHPLREGMRAQLMLALFRCGRQADALRVCREGRQRLAEIGAEPGRRLRDLELAVLRDDPALHWQAATPATPAAPTVVVPAELPAALSRFTGREAEVEQLRGQLDRDPAEAAPIPVISGGGGAGKSTLAIHIAHGLAERFPDGQLYADLHGSGPGLLPVDPRQLLRRFLTALGVEAPPEPAGLDELSRLFRSATADKRLLILLDNAHDAAQVRPLLSAGPGCRAIVTSRRNLASLEAAVPLRLGAFTPAEATTMLERLTTGRGTPPEPEALADIARLCGGLPLALSVAAAHLNRAPGLPASELARRLAVEHRRLATLSLEDRDVRASFMLSYRDLSDGEEARMFRLLGLHTGPDIGLPAAAALAATDIEAARDRLEALTDTGLVESPEPDRYRVHDLLRLFARELAESGETGEERTAAVLRMLHRYLATTRQALTARGRDLPADTDPRIAARFQTELSKRVRLAPATDEPAAPFASKAAAYAWVNAEFDNLVAVVARAAEHGQAAARIAAAVPAALQPLLTRRDRMIRMRDLCLLCLRVATRHDDSALLYLAHYDLGQSARDRDPRQAFEHFGQAVEAARRCGDPEWEALALLWQAELLRGGGRFTEAVTALRRCLAVARDSGDPVGESGAWLGLGRAYQDLGYPARSVLALWRALAVARQAGHHYHHAEAWNELGRLHNRHGFPEAGVELADRALRLIEKMDVVGSGTHAGFLWSKAEALYALGRHTEARDVWDRAIEILVTVHMVTESEAGALSRQTPPTPPPGLRP